MIYYFQQVFFFMIFLFPVASYLAVLAGINRRSRPWMVPGVWDGVGLLCASSGFLLAAGPAILAASYEKIGESLIVWDAPILQEIWTRWWIIYGLYYCAVVGGAAWLLWSRRRSTIIYNIGPSMVDELLSQTFERLGLAWLRTGNRIKVHAAQPVEASSTHIVEGAPNETGIPSEPVIGAIPAHDAPPVMQMTVDTFPTFFNVALHVATDRRELSEELNRELRKSVDTMYTHGNPCGGWFFGLSGMIFGFMVICILAMLILMIQVIYS